MKFKEAQNQVFAIKTVHGDFENIEKEINVLKQVRGDNIVRYYGCVSSNREYLFYFSTYLHIISILAYCSLAFTYTRPKKGRIVDHHGLLCPRKYQRLDGINQHASLRGTGRLRV